jgi:hypothetical protein
VFKIWRKTVEKNLENWYIFCCPIYCDNSSLKFGAEEDWIIGHQGDMAMNRIFRGFCINRFCIGPLHYISSRSDFGFELSEIFAFEKRLPDSTIRGVGDSNQRYAESTIRGVDDSPHHWYAESTTPRITGMVSRLLNFLKENSYGWYGESSTPRIVDTRVADSPYRWVSGSRRLRAIVDTESRYLNKKLVLHRFSIL